MPYVSPALSPTKTFSRSSSSSSVVANYYPSPPGSTTSSAMSSPTTPSGTSTRSGSNAAPVEFDPSYSRGFPSSSSTATATATKRPTHRHHARSHSSDALSSSINGYHRSNSSSSNGSSSGSTGPVKSTPGYIFVHPASPAADPSAYSYYGRPSLRHSGSSRTSTSSVSTVTPADDGDVAPPRSSSSSRRAKKFHMNGSADSSPRMSMSLENGQAFQLPLPDLDAMSPPAYSNRRSSVQYDEPSADEEGERTPPASTATQMNGYHDSFTALRVDEEEDGEDTEQGEADGGQYSHMLRSTDLPANDSALATSSESNSSESVSGSSNSSDNEETPDHHTNKHKSSTARAGGLGGRVTDPSASSSSSADLLPDGSPSTVARQLREEFVQQHSGDERQSSDSTLSSVKRHPRPSWGETPSYMGNSTSFSFAKTPTTPTAPSDDPTPSNNGQMSSSSAASGGSTAYPSGPLAPVSTKPRRPNHGKAFSERAESPFRLELGHTQRERRREFSEGSSRSHRPTPLPTPMLRKKSGELVKSSLKHDSRAKSAPTTPTGPKAVHFDEQLERVKLFLAQQRPTAVSRDGSPIETETEDDSEAAFPFPPMTTSIPAQITLVLPQFPNNQLPELGHRDVCMESLEIAADSKSLKGSALLRNISFEKRLSIRFTFDDWQTVSEVTGEWGSTLVGGSIDRWSFSIKLQDMLARIEDKTMYLALRYSVEGRELWDSNNGANYKAEFRKTAPRTQAVVGGARAARHEWAVTNPGQASERMADLRRELDRLVADQDDFNSADELVIAGGGAGAGGSANKTGQRAIKYQPRFIGGESVPLAQAPATSTFSSRYDFGASLKTASTHRNSPQSAHAILDNPYFASPQAGEATLQQWQAAAMSPPLGQQAGMHPSPPKPTFASLYNDGAVPMANSSIIGGMPATSFNPTPVLGAVDPSSMPASFTGSSYYPRSEVNGVISTDFGMPNYLQPTIMSFSKPPPSPPTDSMLGLPPSSSDPVMPYFSAGQGLVERLEAQSALMGGAPLSRQNRNASFPPSSSRAGKGAWYNNSLEPTLDSMSVDPLDTSQYSPAVSPPSLSPPRRASPPPHARSNSPDDLLSPSPSSASTDTSISTPQSPNGSPPLAKLYAPFGNAGGRPDMGSDTYFNFVHRCESRSETSRALEADLLIFRFFQTDCWGNGDSNSPSAASSASSTSTALGLAGMGVPMSMDTSAIPTPRRGSPPASCSVSLLSSPNASRSGSRTPSPVNGSPVLESVARLESKGYMHGPPTVEI